MLILLTGPDQQAIYLNPQTVVSLRRSRAPDHVGKGAHCLIHTADGKFVAVIEQCETVRRKIEP